MTDNPAILMGVLFVAAYAIGSTPFGVILAKLYGKDLRKVGSGNVGATNVARALGRKWGYVCFFLDVAKGFGPTLAVSLWSASQPNFPTLLHQGCWLAVGVGAVMGHVFSFWLKCRGGKGVATSLGVVLGIHPYSTWAGLVAFAVWIVVTLVSRYVSLGSIIAVLVYVGAMLGINYLVYAKTPAELWPMCVFSAVVATMVIVRHRENIRRLLAGTENKIGRKKTPPR